MRTGREAGYEPQILRAAEKVNQEQKARLCAKVRSRLGDDLTGKVIAVWGLAFKANTDDMREAPSIVLINELLERGATVNATDPEALDNSRQIFGDRVHWFDRNYDAVNGADALVLVTEWNEYRRPNFRLIKERMRAPHIIDGRNIWGRAALEEYGFSYDGIGM
jgi:UDPglucose 6-dehydrogenase